MSPAGVNCHTEWQELKLLRIHPQCFKTVNSPVWHVEPSNLEPEEVYWKPRYLCWCLCGPSSLENLVQNAISHMLRYQRLHMQLGNLSCIEWELHKQWKKEKGPLAAISFVSFEKIQIHEGITLQDLLKLELIGVDEVLSPNLRRNFYPILYTGLVIDWL